MVTIGANGNVKAYGIKHFILDTPADLKDVATENLSTGSTVFVISTSEHYMLNSSKSWIKVNLGSGSSGGSGDDTPDSGNDSIEYDGGDVL